MVTWLLLFNITKHFARRKLITCLKLYAGRFVGNTERREVICLALAGAHILPKLQ